MNKNDTFYNSYQSFINAFCDCVIALIKRLPDPYTKTLISYHGTVSNIHVVKAPAVKSYKFYHHEKGCGHF